MIIEWSRLNFPPLMINKDRQIIFEQQNLTYHIFFSFVSVCVSHVFVRCRLIIGVETHIWCIQVLPYGVHILCEVITHSFDGQSWFNFKNYAHMLLNYIYDIDGYHVFLLISYQHSLQYDSPYYGRWNRWIIEPLVVSGYMSFRLQCKRKKGKYSLFYFWQIFIYTPKLINYID